MRPAIAAGRGLTCQRSEISMTFLSAYRAQWFSAVRGDLLSGLVVALALIPEAIAFSILSLIHI